MYVCFNDYRLVLDYLTFDIFGKFISLNEKDNKILSKFTY